MSRPTKDRLIAYEPDVVYFKPKGIPLRKLQEVSLTLDEFESLRLSDHCCLSQSEGAEKMGIHQSTFQRTLSRARGKIAEALVNGMAIRIVGGPYCVLPQEDAVCAQDLERERGTYRGESMKIAFSTMGSTQEDPVEPRFGRCARFLVYDPHTKETTILENEGAAGGGAGIQAAELLARNGVTVVVTGHTGANATTTLEAAGIRVVTAAGSPIREALARVLNESPAQGE
ncbi:MAG: DUF134 domain-containing protein [Candidatus Methanofastidiosa archaeon]|nr:DUF134 domain-containing protein [Candidatus Methanofastidiosa archaeon]MDD4281155.1 DUF134 domain-containing protein [Candidatus Methanofastidiosa archaeon]